MMELVVLLVVGPGKMVACENDGMTHEPQQSAANPEPQAAPHPAFEAAYRAAQKSVNEGGIPIGAALARDGVVIASGHNERVPQTGDPIASAPGVIGEARTFARVRLLRSRGVEVVVLDDQRCVDMMLTFQENNPDLWAEDIAEDIAG